MVLIGDGVTVLGPFVLGCVARGFLLQFLFECLCLGCSSRSLSTHDSLKMCNVEPYTIEVCFLTCTQTHICKYTDMQHARKPYFYSTRVGLSPEHIHRRMCMHTDVIQQQRTHVLLHPQGTHVLLHPRGTHVLLHPQGLESDATRAAVLERCGDTAIYRVTDPLPLHTIMGQWVREGSQIYESSDSIRYCTYRLRVYEIFSSEEKKPFCTWP